MKLPLPLLTELEGRVGPVESAEDVMGGCISAAFRIVAGGTAYFLKYEAEPPAGFFEAEAAGLEQLAAATPLIRVPKVVSVGAGENGYGWILMEWLEPLAPGPDSDFMLGTGLAALHRCGAEGWGWRRDGYIGRLPQSNRNRTEWPDFWWRERLEPQLRHAAAAGLPRDDWELLESRLPDLLAPAADDGPSVLHGDLWSGNVIFTADGPAVIDPACYHGHREVDLAMAELFGGFGRDFFRAYLDAWPLAAGWEIRRQVYQLYYLLVHVNLFGAEYESRTQSTLRSVLAA